MEAEGARSGWRSRSATPGSTPAWTSAWSSWPRAWRKSGSSSSGGSSPLGGAAGFAWAIRASLFRLYKQGQTVPADHAHGRAGLDAALAAGPPELSFDAHLPHRGAGGHDLGA